jgi:hypothetical protein
MPARVVRPAGTALSVPDDAAAALQQAASDAIAAFARR